MCTSLKLPDPEEQSSYNKTFFHFLRNWIGEPLQLLSADPRSPIREPFDEGEDFVVFYSELFVPKLRANGVHLRGLARFMILRSFREGVDVKAYYMLLYVLERIESSRSLISQMMTEYCLIYVILYLLSLSSEEREIICCELFTSCSLFRNPSIYHELRPLYERFYSEGCKLRTDRSERNSKGSSYRRGRGYRDQGNARESWRVQLPVPLEIEEQLEEEDRSTRIQEVKKVVHHLLDLFWVQ